MKILVIEDDQALCDATTLQLEKEGYEVDKAYRGDDGLFLILEGVYDLIILDRMLPGMDGVALLHKIREKEIKTPVLLVTAMGGIGDRVDGLDAGADDYLTKPFDIRELLARVRALARRPGEISQSQEIRYGDLMLDMSSLYLEGGAGRCGLSKKEAELLYILMKSDGGTLSRSVLFARVWGADADVEEASLDSYAHFVRRRLKAVSNKVALVTVRG